MKATTKTKTVDNQRIRFLALTSCLSESSFRGMDELQEKSYPCLAKLSSAATHNESIITHRNSRSDHRAKVRPCQSGFDPGDPSMMCPSIDKCVAFGGSVATASFVDGSPRSRRIEAIAVRAY